MTSSNNVLAASGGKSEAAPAAQKRPYRAFEASKEEQRYLEIRLKYPEPAECVSNALLTNIRAEWRAGQSVTLEYGQTREGLLMMVVIEGDNLTELYQAIKAWKVEWIAEFNREDYAAAADDGAPFIRSITVQTRRPEEPPSAEKRH